MAYRQDMAQLHKVIGHREKEIEYIHVFPRDIAFFSVLGRTVTDAGADGTEKTSYSVLFLNRLSMLSYMEDGEPIPVKTFSLLKKKGVKMGADATSVSNAIQETGLIMHMNGGLYGVTAQGLTKMLINANLQGVYERSCIHDMMLAERLLAVAAPDAPAAAHNLNSMRNTKGYTFAVNRNADPNGKAKMKGMITGMYSGYYDGMPDGGLQALCEFILDGTWCKGGSVHLSGYRFSRDRIEIEFTAGTPIRYEAGGKEHVLEKRIMVADSNSGYTPLTISGMLHDPETGDTVIVREEKHRHSSTAAGKAGRRANTLPDTLLAVGEAQLPLIWNDVEEFADLITGCMEREAEDGFMERAMSAGISGCIGRKRAKALMCKAEGKNMPEGLHMLMHTKTLIRDDGGIKPLPPAAESDLQMALAEAIRAAAEKKEE